MLIRWRELAPDFAEEGLQRLREGALCFWRACAAEDWERASGVLTELSPRLSFERVADGSRAAELVFLCEERAARPMAQWLVESLPPGQSARLGRKNCSHEPALRLVLEELGISLETARIRVGFSRGHLQEIVVQIPLDVVGTPEALQLAAEIYLEACIGEEFLDGWVSDISVDRIGRSSGLMMVRDVQAVSANFPLAEAASLMRSGADALREALPESLLQRGVFDEEWTALDIPPQEAVPQGDRLFASTCHPEALKAALEGLPFSSHRFTRGPEIFLWMAWETKGVSLDARVKLREEVEALFGIPWQAGQVSLAGTGFGAFRDFVDLWILPEALLIRRLAEAMTAIVGPVSLGFYDSEWAEEAVNFQPLKGVG